MMKKAYIPALLALLSLLTLCGCHGSRGQNAFSVPDSFDESRQYEITFWAKNDTNKTQVDIYNKAITDFQALYPNISVKLRLYTDYGKIYNDVITNIATNTTPNVCITYPDHIATYLTGSNVVAPLDGLFADERYGLGGSALKYDGPAMEEIIPQFLEECSFSGSHQKGPARSGAEALQGAENGLVRQNGLQACSDDLVGIFSQGCIHSGSFTGPAPGQTNNKRRRTTFFAVRRPDTVSGYQISFMSTRT